jgi:hypothetical protein
MKITENKSTLARLLAKENINVTSTAKSTAYFDVKSRTLALPNWKDRGQSVMDMLIGHEVGHALYTPADAIEKFKERCPGVPFDICNIVEDIRIERIIQNTYPGLPRLFTEAYTELVEADFFGVAGKDLDTLKFADRLNLRGKIGKISDIPLTEDEELIYQKCLAAETFDEVLDICAEIAESFKKEPKQPQPEETENEETSTDDGDSDNEGESENGESNEDETDDGSEASAKEAEDSDKDDSEVEADSSSSDIEADENAEDVESDSETDETSSGEANEDMSELVSETQENFDSNLEDEVEDSRKLGYVTAMAPRRSAIYDNICDYKTLIADREHKFASLQKLPEWYDKYQLIATDLRKKTKKKASILAREFERRKAAYQYSRSTESRTGMIDVNKLHSYKLTDEIFLSKSVLANAKSHGMVFLLDYSGSMGSVITDVIEQTLNLVEFCRLVGIPYDVYSFTSAYAAHKTWMAGKHYAPAPNEVDLSDTIIIHHLSSEMSKNDFKKASDNLWLQVALQGSRTIVTAPYEELGGTPLDSTLTAMYTVVKDFITKNKVQKTMFVTLTDGDSSRFRFSEPDFYGNYSPVINLKTRDKNFNISGSNSTRDLIKAIGSIPTVMTMGFFLPQGKRELKRQLNIVSGYNPTKKQKLSKLHTKEGYVEISDVKGYNTYYVLNDVSIADTDFEVKGIKEDIATSKRAQIQLAKQFASHNSGNKKNRVLMNSIASKVA